MTKSYDVAIIGSGIVGLGAAYAAHRRGKSVVVIDRTDDVVGSTIRNFGHICTAAQSGRAREYANVARAAWLTLARDAQFWVRECGTTIAAQSDDELRVIEAAAAEGDIDLLSPEDTAQRVPIAPRMLLGGGLIRPDLQTNPREAAGAIRAYLARSGVEFRMRTAVGSVRSGEISTTRGVVRADLIVVAVNHDLDQLFPELAEAHGVVRCALDMLRVTANLATPFTTPLLTGWSLLRYSRFAALPEARTVRERLHTERPDLAAMDLNQMYTQLPDGSIIVGDTHARSTAPLPFQDEVWVDLMLEEFRRLFGAAPRVVERWQGIYASGRDEFLVATPQPGVQVLTVTTGIGMTTGLGLAEMELAAALD